MTKIQFMATAKSKYDDLVEAGTWLQKDDTENHLVALTAQLEQIKIKHKNLQKKWKDNQKKKKKDDTTLYLPSSPDQILCPQHWSQE